MKALTVHAPWSEAIKRGWKPVENRSWSTKHRGDLAIHAGLAWSARAAEAPHMREAWHAWARTVPLRDTAGHPESGTPGTLRPGNMWIDLGTVVAVVNVIGCHQAAAVHRTDGTVGVCCEPWGEPDGWHWELANARPCLDGVTRLRRQCRGRQSIWNLDPAVEAAVLESIR